MTKEFVTIYQDEITISDKNGEIVKWVEDEWIEDSCIIILIANAIKLAYKCKCRQTLRGKL